MCLRRPEGGNLMKSIARPLVLVALACAFALVWYARRSQNVVMAQAHTPVTATRLYTGADGLSHFEQITVNLSPVAGASATVEESEHIKDTSSYVVRCAPGYSHDWGNADKRRYVVPISGKAEVQVPSGERISVEPGRIYLAEDLTGKGHTFRVVGAGDWIALFVDFAQ